jgi:hypothetical protein
MVKKKKKKLRWKEARNKGRGKKKATTEKKN